MTSREKETRDYNGRMRMPLPVSHCRGPSASLERCRQPVEATGFTLIEIMVVIVILGILAALVVPRVIERPDEARVIAAKNDIAAIMQALKLYRLDNQRYPTTEQGLVRAGREAYVAAGAAELETQRLSGTTAQGSVGQSLPVPQSRTARRDRRVQLRRRRPAGRDGLRRRHRFVGSVIARAVRSTPDSRSPRSWS